MNPNLRNKLRRNCEGKFFSTKKLEPEEIKFLDKEFEKLDSNLWGARIKDFSDLKFTSKKKATIIGKGMSLDFLHWEEIKESNVFFINEVAEVLDKNKFINGYSLIFDYHLNDKIQSQYPVITGPNNYSWYPESYCLREQGLGSLTVEKALELAKYMGAEEIDFYGFDSCLENCDYDTRYADRIDPNSFKTNRGNERFRMHRTRILDKCKKLSLKTNFKLPELYKKKLMFQENLHITDKIKIIRKGTNNPVIFLPYLGEAGWFFMWHVHMVNQFYSTDKTVYCRDGEQVFFPTATRFILHNYKIPDKDRSGARHNLDFAIIKKQFSQYDLIPSNWLNGADEENIPDNFYDIPLELKTSINIKPFLDVIIGPRYRERAPQRNWTHWEKIKAFLDSNNISYGIIGEQETIDPIFRESLILNNNESAIFALKNCKLYIGNDSGSSHLAALCKAKSLIFRFPSQGDRTNRMRILNPDTKIIDGWNNVPLVLTTIQKLLGELL